MIPNFCCLFFGLHGSLSKGKGILGRVRRRKGNLAYFSLARARTRAPEFLSPSLLKACHSDFLLFFIVYDVDVVWVSFLYL